MSELQAKADLLKSFMMYIAVFWLIARGADLVLFRWFVFHKTGFTTPALLRGLSYALFVFVGISLFLLSIGHPITGFLVSTGLAAGILGFALQSTLNDLFSGIALSLEKSFRVGEWIELEDKTVGQVIDLTWRSTRLKTFSNTMLSVPNSVMARQSINNLVRPDDAYGVWYMIRISAQADPKLVVTILSAAVGQCRHVLTRPVPSVRLNDASGAPYKYMVWVHYRSYLAHFRGQEQLFTEIHNALSNAGVTPVGEVQEVRYAKASAVDATSPSIADTLRSMEIFTELDENEINQIAGSSEYILIPTDTVLLTEGTVSNKVHVVVNGSLESSISVDDGQPAVFEQLCTGESIGWTTIVTDQKAIMTVRATSDSLVLAINADALRPILQRHESLHKVFSQLVSDRIHRIASIRTEKVEERRSLSPVDIRHRIERFIASGSGRH